MGFYTQYNQEQVQNMQWLFWLRNFLIHVIQILMFAFVCISVFISFPLLEIRAKPVELFQTRDLYLAVPSLQAKARCLSHANFYVKTEFFWN